MNTTAMLPQPAGCLLMVPVRAKEGVVREAIVTKSAAWSFRSMSHSPAR
ncbi:hypothetical protein [Streptomyces nojiriensis]|nr:hypothetical protein [Streptomyces nojiriensis]